MKRVFLSSFVLLFIIACTEKTQVNVIQGQLFESCNTAIGGVEIALKANEGSGFNNPIILGSDVTNADGTFSFTYELEEDESGSGSILMIKKRGFKTLISSIELNESLNLNLYNRDTVNLSIELQGSRIYTANDTLFYAYNGLPTTYFVSPPQNGILANLVLGLAPIVNSVIEPQVYYGIGKVNFNQAKQLTGTAGATQSIAIGITPCFLTDTTRIVID